MSNEDTKQCVIARNINGISINGYEYVLERGKVKVFEDKDRAISFLKSHGYSDDDIYYLRFLSYGKLLKNEYEEVTKDERS